MIGTILVNNLHIQCIIGVLLRERTTEQSIFVDLELDYDFEPARHSEDIKDALDYTRVIHVIKELLIAKKYQLIETAVEDICALLFNHWPMIVKCSVQVKKPDAIPEASFAAAKIVRKNEKV